MSGTPAVTRVARARAQVAALPATARRTWWQRAQVVAYVVLATALATAALVAPQILARVATEELRTNVADAGPAVDIAITQDVLPGLDGLEPVPAQLVEQRALLPDRLRAATGDPVAMVSLESVRATLGDAQYDVTPVVPSAADVTWVAGGPPVHTDQPEPDIVQSLVNGEPLHEDAPARRIEIGLPAAMADAMGVGVGDRIVSDDQKNVLEVVGVFEPAHPDDTLWRHLSGLRPVAAFLPARAVTALAAAPPPPEPEEFYRYTPLGTSLWIPLDAARLDLESRAALGTQAQDLVDDPSVFQVWGFDVAATTALPAVVASFDARYATARSQVATMLIGLASGAALVLWLAAGTFVARRRPALALERARGASLPSVVVRAVAEATVIGALVAGAAVLVARQLGDLPHGSALVPAALVLTAVVAAPVVLAVRAAAASWNPRRVPTDRDDRAAQERVRRSWGVAAKALVVLLAVAAVAAAGARGFDHGGDLFVAAAPVLLAAACTVLLLVVVPFVLRLGTRLAARRPSVVALVAASRAAAAGDAGARAGRRSESTGTGAAASVLSLVMVTALAVFAGAQAATVQTARARAIDASVGAAVRVDHADQGYAAWLSGEHPELTVRVGTVIPNRELGSNSGVRFTLLAVDDPGAVPQFAALADAGPAVGDRLPALLDPRLAGVQRRLDPKVAVGKELVALDPVGAVDLSTSGPSLDGAGALPTEPVVVVDRKYLRDAAEAEDIVWIDGPGAAEAAAAPAGRRSTVTDSAAIAEQLRTDPLIGGVTTLLRVSVLVLALLAAVVAALTVLAGAGDRLRVLAVLRTLGVPRRAGRSLAFGELAPLLVASVLVGSAAGVLLTTVLVPAQGLEVLAYGGAIVPELPWWVFCAVPVAALVALGVGAWFEERGHRHARVGEVLRTW